MDTDNNIYLLPDLDIEEDRSVAILRSTLVSYNTNETYIFPIPFALNCGGTVTAIRYCYTGDSIGTEQSVFKLLTLQQINLDIDFIITDVIPVRSNPTRDICTARPNGDITIEYCCDTLSLDMRDRFPLPVPNFAFGVLNEAGLLMYNARRDDLFVEHFRFPNTVIGTATSGGTITVSESDRQTNRALGLLQFFISKSITSGEFLNS